MKRALALLAALSTACSDPAPGASDATLDAAVDASADAPVKPDVPAFSCPRVRPATPPATRVCNGSAAVCARRFDEVSWLTSHNAMSSEARSFASPNQHETITAQLQRGVRGLMLDVHPWHDDVWLCHGTCLAGAQRHVEGLCEVARFLDANPTEVVTIIYESYVPGASVVADLRAVGLDADAGQVVDRAVDAGATVRARGFTATESIVYGTTQGYDCSLLIGAQTGQFSAMPCQATYQMAATRVADDGDAGADASVDATTR